MESLEILKYRISRFLRAKLRISRIQTKYAISKMKSIKSQVLWTSLPSLWAQRIFHYAMTCSLTKSKVPRVSFLIRPCLRSQKLQRHLKFLYNKNLKQKVTISSNYGQGISYIFFRERFNSG